MKKIIMQCGLCSVTHEYKNPKQFTSWARRHRKTKHEPLGPGFRIAYVRVKSKSPREKQWKFHSMKPPCNPRAMLKLPSIFDGHGVVIDVYHDRKTGIFWKHTSFDGWLYHRPKQHAPIVHGIQTAKALHRLKTGEDINNATARELLLRDTPEEYD